MFSISIKWWLINALITLPLYGFAQLHQNGRFEIPIQIESESFSVTSAKELGLVIHRRMTSRSGDYIEMIYTDTSFHERWRGDLPVSRNYILGNQTVVDEYLYFILHDENLSIRNFDLYKVNLKNGEYIKFIVRNSIPFVPSMLEATPFGAVIGGQYNRVPIVLYFQLVTQKSIILPGLFNEPGELSQIKTNTDATFDLLIFARNYQKQKTLWLKRYDRFGKLLENIILLPGGNNNLIFGRLIKTRDDVRIIAGVYGKRNGEYAQGLFVAKVGPGREQKIEYSNFYDLENFFKYLKPRQENRVKKRIHRKLTKGKEFRIQYRFLVHELAAYKNQFILLGEAFYKRYKNPSASPMMTSATDPIRIFDGYQYTHAAVLGISPTGTLLWDNSFEINDIRTFKLEQFVRMSIHDDKISLLYLYENKIRTKIIQDSTVLEGKTYSPLKTMTSSDLLTEESSTINKLDYWYADYFLAYGVQTIISYSPQGRTKKKVFFVNKLSCE